MHMYIEFLSIMCQERSFFLLLHSIHVIFFFITIRIKVTANNIENGEGDFGDPNIVDASTG